jgi:hypothetical protein
MIIIDRNELIEVTTLFHLGTAHNNRYDFSLPLLCYLSLTLMFTKLAPAFFTSVRRSKAVQSYHVGYTSCHSNTEFKLHWACMVLGWEALQGF